MSAVLCDQAKLMRAFSAKGGEVVDAW